MPALSSDPPKVSVVITCYNYERYVGLAIASVVGQTHPAHELVVVNDGSADNSEAVIKSFPQARYLGQPNSGQAVGFNNAVATTSGEIVLFLDADDVLEPDAIEHIVKHWKPGAAKLQFDMTAIDADGDSMGRRVCNFHDDYDEQAVREEFERFGTYLWPVCSGNAFARAYLDQVLPLPPGKVPDGFMITLAPLYGPVIVVNKPLVRYRLHNQNFSYHGTDRSRMDLRFAKQIDLRLYEIGALREHAQRRGVKLPDVFPLDVELPFINYRLMLKKMGARYTGDERDSAFSLWRKGVALLSWKRRFRAKVRVANLAWLTVLLLSPRALANALVMLRFNRAEYLKKLRRLSPLSHA
jgi:glycosyltransferase involved in cell wall biosynthesis